MILQKALKLEENCDTFLFKSRVNGFPMLSEGVFNTAQNVDP
jgi:hypothetical protein